MQESACPDPARLTDYALQRLPEDEALAVKKHLQECGNCRIAVDSLHCQRDELPPHTQASAADDTGKGKQAEPAADLSVHEDLGEYRLLEKLGEGGMGAVYKALHTRLEKVVALKMLSKKVDDAEWLVKRFEREMKAIGRVTHPNIVQAYDAREIGGTRFLVMEYVDGLNLDEIVRRRGPLPLAEACELARQAALGLQAAHEHGLVHRDVKPSNLMLTRQGQVKVLDLGLARVQSVSTGSGETTASGQIMGTADYIAPEQVTDCHNVDIRADIYSLGCTLYRFLTGEVPFGGSEYESPFQKMSAHVLKAAPPIRRLRSDVPEPLASLVHRMMAKDPATRFATPADVAQALAPFAAACDLSRLWEQAPLRREFPAFGARPVAPHRGRWAIVLAAVAVGGLAFWGASHFLTPGRPTPTPAEQAAAKGRTGDKGGQLVGTTAIKTPPKVRRPSAPPPDTRKARQLQDTWTVNLGIPKEQSNSIGMKLVLVPPGEFLMGTDLDELGGLNKTSNESPPHRVAITQPFLLGAYEVSRAEYQQVMGSNPSTSPAKGNGKSEPSAPDRSRHPVDTVSWSDAVKFCQKLSVSQAEHSARRVYRLPTEAEWEYACRAGSETRWYCGDNEDDVEGIAWNRSNSNDTTHAVGQREPNAWGLYDMLGNVYEWCLDWYAHDYYQQSPTEDPIGPSTGLDRVIRGGSWYNAAAFCRSASRVGAPLDGSNVIGFRVLCELPATPRVPAKPPSEPARPQPAK
jgi:eukaryotic-like serine/threonine-protein kinase